MRIELMQALLSCHCLTFQIFEYARHFLTCCKFLLNCNYSFQEGGILQVEHESRSIVIRTDHVVLPYQRLLKRLDAPTVEARAASIRDKFPDRTIFAAIDGDEPFAGLTLKLRAFQTFVSDCPQHRHRVALIQHILVTKKEADESRELISILRQMADEVNRTYCSPGAPPLVVIQTDDTDVDERLAILLATDVLLDTSINDGLNLYPFMFYCAHSKTRKGAVIVSEFTGCSSVLTGAVKVNPWNTKAVMEAMHEVMTLEKSQQAAMFTKDHSYVSTQTFDGWVTQNLQDLKAAPNGAKRQLSLEHGFEKRFMDCGFRALNFESVVRDYRECKGARLIFLDNEGTLSPDRRAALRYGVNSGLVRTSLTCDTDTLESLRNLASDQKNIVVVISGRERELLDDCFSDIPNLGLCAEHGFYWTLPGRLQAGGTAAQDRSTGSRWHCMKELSDEDNDWKTVCVELFKQYTKRVQGSMIEEKGSAVTWIYSEVGAQDLAQHLALELARLVDPNEPQGLMSGYPVMVVSGKGYVEVKRADVNTGLAVQRTLQMIQQQLKLQVDFVLCIGDARSDEDMFEAINILQENSLGGGGQDVSREGRSMSSCSVMSGTPSVQSCTGLSNTNSNPLLGYSTDKGGSSGSLTTITEPQSPSSLLRKPPTFPKTRKPSTDEDNYTDEPQFFYTATVGRKPSNAKYFVKDIDSVSTLLQKLAKEGIRTKFSKFSSVPNLLELGQQMGACMESELEMVEE